MLKKSLVIATLAASVATGTLSTDASAQGDPFLGGLVGAGIGAAIGHSVNGSNGAWVGGALGALTGASIAANSGGYYGNGYVAPPIAFVPPAPVFYGPPAVVYRPRPVFFVPRYAPRFPAPRWGYVNGRWAGANFGGPVPAAHWGQNH